MTETEKSRDKSSAVIDSNPTVKKYLTPAQDALSAQINFNEKQLIAAIDGRDSGLAESGIQKKIDKLRKQISTDKKKLKTAKSKALKQKKYRLDRSKALQMIKADHPNIAKSLHVS